MINPHLLGPVEVPEPRSGSAEAVTEDSRLKEMN
jgi:hypothetical protein